MIYGYNIGNKSYIITFFMVIILMNFNLDKLIIVLLILCFTILIPYQYKNYYDILPKINSLDVYSDSELYLNNILYGFIILRIHNQPKFNKTEILINGEVIDYFHDEYMKIKVYKNDILQINSNMYNESVLIEIISTSSNIVTTNLETRYEINNCLYTIGRIKIN